MGRGAWGVEEFVTDQTQISDNIEEVIKCIIYLIIEWMIYSVENLNNLRKHCNVQSD